MKKTLIILIVLVTTTLSFSQSEKYHLAFENFKTNYNLGQYDAIFDSFSLEMQKALPIANCSQFFGRLQLQAGKITNFSFQKMKNQSYAVYKTTFERDVFSIQISIDDKDKINGLLVKPLMPTAASRLVNNLSTYPKEIATIIFENTKNFPTNTQLTIAIIKDGKTNYYGVQVANDTLIEVVNQDKCFEIGSLSKVFTSTILAELVVADKLKLSDNINSYYPFSFKNSNKITFESLANHTSGLPRLPTNLEETNDETPYKTYGAKELDFYLKNEMQLTKDADNVYGYSNLGAGLLGYTLGISQKTTLQSLFKDLIFRRYKMNNSFTSSNALPNKLVRGLNEDGEVVSNWDFDVLLGAGGIISTTADLVQFAEAQFDVKNKALELTRKSTSTVNESMEIGLGWHLVDSDKSKHLIWHNGGTGGYSSSMVLDVKNKNGIIILSNVSGLSSQHEKIDALGFELLSEIEK
ncbi:serine hydrolase [Flavobacterium antarcticum]|uniref:serine hydrolase n=1 Tax=Flavobacterium antarcticum TaxID=271155 RepID=UPI0003B5574F|nr:serine hydrolase [Flavobacterium antarcticum]